MNNNQLLHNITMLQRFKADSDLWKQECKINNQSVQNFFNDKTEMSPVSYFQFIHMIYRI